MTQAEIHSQIAELTRKVHQMQDELREANAQERLHRTDDFVEQFSRGTGDETDPAYLAFKKAREKSMRLPGEIQNAVAELGALRAQLAPDGV